ncbi:MAG: hypothetical protein KGL55_08015 [Rhodospirillales bacterium]|nr:hypothetical protein [Rhodospirillales bacterium]
MNVPVDKTLQSGCPPQPKWPVPYLLILAAGLVAGLLRFNPGLFRDLWEDEVIAASHADQPFWRLPAEVLRFDVHPFLYFMQLHAWSFLGSGDLWLRLNSIAWNLAAVASMFLVVRRLYGVKAGWIAASLFAVSAPVVWMAQEVRPYSWLYVLLIWAFYFIELWFSQARHGLNYKIPIYLFCISIIYSHTIGFFAVFLFGLYAFGRMIETGPTRRAVVEWVAMFAFCALTAVPPLAVDLMRDANLGAGGGDRQRPCRLDITAAVTPWRCTLCCCTCAPHLSRSTHYRNGGA